MPSVGQSVPMIDARERVTGRVQYTLNMKLPGMLVGRVLRSPYPHARVLRVDASQAERLPGVAAVLTRADFEGRDDVSPLYGPFYLDQSVVALDKVRFAGDAVAAVAAVDDDTAQAALDLIQVEYEPLPAIFDPQEATRPDAPLLYEQPPARGRGFHGTLLQAEGHNICNHFKLRHGDVEQGFRESDLVVEHTFRIPPMQHVPLEPHVAIAHYESGRVTIWSGTQTPHVVRAQIADMFRLPISRVRLIVPTLGGGYGAKCYPKLEPLASMLAWKARRPVKIAADRSEDFLLVSQPAAVVHMKTGVKQDGTFVARQVTAFFNMGAYADIAPRVAQNGGYATIGPYRVPYARVDSYGVWTNIVPAGAFRGYGVSQAAWAYENQIDMIAEQLGLSPYELRRKNLLRDGDHFATGERMEDLHLDTLLDEAAAAVDWRPDDVRWQRDDRADGLRDGKRRGKGLAIVMKATGTPSTSTAGAKLNEDGSLNILTSSVEMGQGAKTVLAQLAADAADLPLDQVLISEPDTDATPYDQSTSSSRTTYSMGKAMALAIEQVREQLLELAAGQLEVSPADLVTENGRVLVRGAPERSRSYGEIIRAARRGNLLGHGTYATQGGLNAETGQGVASVHWHQAVASCEVEVDTATGKVEVLHFHGGVWAGRAVNPRQCELQTEGSSLFGLGQALFEEMIYRDGQLANANLSDYMIASFKDVPARLSTGVLEQKGDGELHGIGETSLPPVMPAIANAVCNAVGVRIMDLPLTPEKILRALEAKRG